MWRIAPRELPQAWGTLDPFQIALCQLDPLPNLLFRQITLWPGSQNPRGKHCAFSVQCTMILCHNVSSCYGMFMDRWMSYCISYRVSNTSS